MNLPRPLRLCAFFATALFACQSQATPLAQVDLDYTGFAEGSRSGTLTTDNGNRGVAAGLFNFDVINPTGMAPWDWGDELEAFCVQIGIRLNHNQTTYNLVEAIDYFGDAEQVDLIGRLYTGFRDQVVNAANSAGFQLALWELVEETSEVLSLNPGSNDSFHSTQFGGSRNIANDWLNSLDDVANEFDLYVLEGAGTQDLLVFTHNTPNDIPIPASLGLFGLGLVLLRTRMQRC